MAFPAQESEFPQFAAHPASARPLSEKSRPGASHRAAAPPPPGAHAAAAEGRPKPQRLAGARFQPPTATAAARWGEGAAAFSSCRPSAAILSPLNHRPSAGSAHSPGQGTQHRHEVPAEAAPRPRG